MRERVWFPMRGVDWGSWKGVQESYRKDQQVGALSRDTVEKGSIEKRENSTMGNCEQGTPPCRDD